jgi:hypothetical protein
MNTASLMKGAGLGTVLQTLMVVVGHFMSPEQQGMLFPIAGTAIGVITGWLSANGTRAMPLGSTAVQGAIAGGVAGVLGSLVSTALGDVPLDNMAIAGGSTLVAGAMGAAIGRAMTPASAR